MPRSASPVDLDQHLRRDLAISLLRALECAVPEGAFYIMPKCAELIGRKTPSGSTIKSSADFCKYLIEAFGVVTVPGAGFFCDPYFRISFPTSEDVITEGCARIVAATHSLSR